MIIPHSNNDEKIKQTDKIIEISKKVMNDSGIPEYAQNLQIDSFKKFKQQIVDQSEIKGEEHLVMTFFPIDVPPGEISVRALTSILGGLQSLTDSIANTIYNQPSEKGKIPQDVLDQNELIFKESKAGSFIAIIEPKPKIKEQISIFDSEESIVLSEVFKLLYSSRNVEELSDNVTFLGPRTLKTFADWTKSIRDLSIPIEMEWISKGKGSHKFTMNHSDAEKVDSVLNDFSNVIEEDIELFGQLVGANTRTRTFELVTETDKITGRVAKDAIKDVASFTLGEHCKVELLKVTTSGSSFVREKINWTLKSLTKSETDLD